MAAMQSGDRETHKRTRLYSWSRPTRELRKQGLRMTDSSSSQHCICGAATLAFHPSGHWFQGNIINPSGDAYTIQGRRCTNSGSSYTKECRLHSVDEEVEERRGGARRDSTTHSPYSNEDEVSVGSLDSALVRSALEHLDLDLNPEVLYNIFITDYETGIEHKIKDVVCITEGDSMRLDTDSLQFLSSSCAKGNRADTVIAANIGPNLVQQGFIVFRGELKMTYKDEPCCPVTLDASQWCL